MIRPAQPPSPDQPETFLDQTAFPDTETALDFLGSVLESSTEYSIIGTDLDGTILLWTAGARRLYGYEAGEVVGTVNSAILYTPEDVAAGAPRDVLDGALSNGHWEGTITRLRKDGEKFVAHVVVTPRRDRAGVPIGFVLIAKDMSGEILLTEELEAVMRRAGERVRSRFVEGMHGAAVAVDTDGRIVMVNGVTERLFGYSRDDIIGQAVEMLLPDIHHDAHITGQSEDVVDATARPMGVGRDTVARCADGTAIPVAITFNTLETDERPLVLASVRDLREEKKLDATRAALEQQLHQSQRLESLGQLAGGIAHDFNNLLMVITFSAELMRDALADVTPDGANRAGLLKNIDQIDRAATSAANLTRQLLLFSRAQPVLAEPIDLNADVSHLEELLRRSIEENIELVMDLAADLPAVMADHGRLEQILVNLVVNARDAMPDGGRVNIRTSLTAESMIQLEIADTGNGMAPEVIARAFEPFFTTKTQGRGTGLGLATVYGVVTDLGGTIELDSTVGRGTRVLVALPTTDHRPRQERAQPVIGGTGERLLLAEDEDDLRGALAEMLRGAGYAVVAAPTGEGAIEAFQHGDFDLLITDVIMPGMSGRQLADRLWEDRPSLRVLFMSGYSNHALDGIEDLGRATDFVPKPVQRDELLSRIRTSLDKPEPSIA
ncbi:MAG: sensor hybrid histidine kinase [Actinomycetia bacterium]|nr:sensor hybrid histidine kinase [Actinomycetes bacterium]